MADIYPFAQSKQQPQWIRCANTGIEQFITSFMENEGYAEEEYKEELD